METDDELDWLGRNGSWVLFILGIALVTVSVIIADKQAVASILAFSGVASAVFGVLLPRLEGDFVLSPTKFAATLKAAREAGAREDLTLEERADLILRLLGVRGDEQAATAATAPETRERELTTATAAESDGPGPGLPRPIPFTVTGATDQVHRVGIAFERHVARVFRDAGWEVEDVSRATDIGFDLLATKDDTTVYIEVKLRRRLSSADARQFVGSVLTRRDDSGAQYVFAVNAGSLSAAAREVLGAVPNIHAWEVPVEGW